MLALNGDPSLNPRTSIGIQRENQSNANHSMNETNEEHRLRLSLGSRLGSSLFEPSGLDVGA